MQPDPAYLMLSDRYASVTGRIETTLAELEQVDRIDHAPQADCWQWHAGCLADRIRLTLTGGDTPADPRREERTP